jgi:hypothetical protein
MEQKFNMILNLFYQLLGKESEIFLLFFKSKRKEFKNKNKNTLKIIIWKFLILLIF